MSDMRGISWLSLWRHVVGATGRQNAAKLRQTAKTQAQRHWTIVDESQMWVVSDLRPLMDVLKTMTASRASVHVWSNATPKRPVDHWTIRRALPDDETHIERGTE